MENDKSIILFDPKSPLLSTAQETTLFAKIKDVLLQRISAMEKIIVEITVMRSMVALVLFIIEFQKIFIQLFKKSIDFLMSNVIPFNKS